MVANGISISPDTVAYTAITTNRVGQNDFSSFRVQIPRYNKWNSFSFLKKWFMLKQKMFAFQYVLLPRESWGNCSDEYPQEYAQSDFPYSMANCQSICKAKYFTDNCGCTPSLYNIAETFPECSPFETYLCIDQHLRTQTNGEQMLSYFFSLKVTFFQDAKIYGVIKRLSWTNDKKEGNTIFFRFCILCCSRLQSM